MNWWSAFLSLHPSHTRVCTHARMHTHTHTHTRSWNLQLLNSMIYVYTQELHWEASCFSHSSCLQMTSCCLLRLWHLAKSWRTISFTAQGCTMRGQTTGWVTPRPFSNWASSLALTLSMWRIWYMVLIYAVCFGKMTITFVQFIAPHSSPPFFGRRCPPFSQSLVSSQRCCQSTQMAGQTLMPDSWKALTGTFMYWRSRIVRHDTVCF